MDAKGVNFVKGGKTPEDLAFPTLVHTMSSDQSKIWNSDDLQQEYKHLGDTKIKQKKSILLKILRCIPVIQ